MRSTVRISVVTPCRNASGLIRETVDSVLSQRALGRGDVELDYVIVDGNSTDGTADIALEAAGGRASVVSEPDSGMYDALAKGFEQSRGDVRCYLNAGDYLHPYAFDVVADVFASVPACSWLTGLAVTYNERGCLVDARLPFRYRRSLIQRGLYGPLLPFIEQESTFWRSELEREVDLGVLRRLKLAGDAYLWNRFAGIADLYVVRAHLGGFRTHAGQLSEALEAYYDELQSLSEPASFIDRFSARLERLLWGARPGSANFFDRKLIEWRDGHWMVTRPRRGRTLGRRIRSAVVYRPRKVEGGGN